MARSPLLVVTLADETETAAFAEAVATGLERGDVIALSGGLGSGKTTFARALLRAVAGNPGLEVPSPTFTLVQAYMDGRLPVHHFDLYRLNDPREMDELGLAEALANGAAVIEWPERAPDLVPDARLDLAFAIVPGGRRLSASGPPSWRDRLSRLRR
jgi:tRNA threonylcarbamoyl adenosine modification protein YjeE